MTAWCPAAAAAPVPRVKPAQRHQHRTGLVLLHHGTPPQQLQIWLASVHLVRQKKCQIEWGSGGNLAVPQL